MKKEVIHNHKDVVLLIPFFWNHGEEAEFNVEKLSVVYLGWITVSCQVGVDLQSVILLRWQ